MKNVFQRVVYGLFVYSITSLFIINISIAQNSSPHETTAILPSSPTTSALAEYGNFPVNLSNGIPNVSIPLYTLKGDGLELPLSLSYHSGGIQIDEISSWVGLGWSLNAGGVITRSIASRPDETSIGYMDNADEINTAITSDDMPTGLLQTIAGGSDGDPDIFNYNFAGYTGQFVFYRRRGDTNDA